MGMNDLFFLGGSKPKLITRITSGSGLYIPTADMARCYVRPQASGAGGSTPLDKAGGAGAMTGWWIRIPLAGLAYAVGAPGAIATDGSPTWLGQCFAAPGTAPTSSYPGAGGPIALTSGPFGASGITLLQSGVQGVAGGAGGLAGAAGMRCGIPINLSAHSNASAPLAAPYQGATFWDNGLGARSGGDSFHGKGGLNGASPLAGAYGAGGGVGAAGLGGCLEIWDFGA